MARPFKQGLDYFPLDIDFFEDEKIEFVRARFGEKGELITIKLLCNIYRNGYSMNWNEDKATIFANRAGKNISPPLVNNVVEELVRRDFFEKSIFNSFGILTSKGIQRRYLRASSERKEVEILEDIWLLELPKNTKMTTYKINRSINRVNPPTNSQSKVEESKVKESKENKENKENKEKERANKSHEKSQNDKFIKPTVEEIAEYCKQRDNTVDPQRFFDYYEACNWFRGKNKIKNWQACVRTWENQSRNFNNIRSGNYGSSSNNGEYTTGKNQRIESTFKKPRFGTLLE